MRIFFIRFFYPCDAQMEFLGVENALAHFHLWPGQSISEIGKWLFLSEYRTIQNEADITLSFSESSKLGNRVDHLKSKRGTIVTEQTR